MLTTFRRHLKSCPHRSEGRKYRRFRYLIWVGGFLGGQEIRKSFSLADWHTAQETGREWEAEEHHTSYSEPKTLIDAWKEFLADLEARKLHDSTIRKYVPLNRQMEDYANQVGFRFLAEFDLSAASQSRST